MIDLFSILEEPRTIQERFERFHANNPKVFQKLLEIARYVKSRRKRAGIRLLWERLRWEFFIEQDAHEDFKLNDHYHSRYVRLLIDTYPEEFNGFFELRELKS